MNNMQITQMIYLPFLKKYEAFPKCPPLKKMPTYTVKQNSFFALNQLMAFTGQQINRKLQIV